MIDVLIRPIIPFESLRQNPELLAKAETRIKQLLQPLPAPALQAALDEYHP